MKPTKQELKKQRDALMTALESISNLYAEDWSDKYRDENMASDMADIASASLAATNKTGGVE